MSTLSKQLQTELAAAEARAGQDSKVSSEFAEEMEKLLVTDIRPDASFEEIKVKAAEIIKISTEVTKRYLKCKKRLSDRKRLLQPIKEAFSKQVNDSYLGRSPKERLDKDGRDNEVRILVNGNEKTRGIYDEIQSLEDTSAIFESIMKHNDQIARRVEDMLNAEINIKKWQNQGQGG
jgi:hypothetical protein